MNNVLKIDKKFHILVKIILFIAFIYLSFIRTLHFGLNTDEMWLFNAANKIHNGLLPYKDFNIVSFPFFYYFMSLFASNLYIYRIFGVVLNALMLFFCAYVFEKNSKDKLSLILLILLCLIKTCYMPFVTYNEFMGIIVLLSFLSLKKYLDTNNSLNIFLTGFLLSLALITKQSVPAVIIIGITPVLIFHFIKHKKYKDFVLYAVGGILPVLTLVIVAIYNNYLFEMIDLTFMGLSDFKIETIGRTTYYLFLLFVVVVSIIIILKSFQNKKIELLDYFIWIYIVSFYVLVSVLKNIFHPVIAFMFTIVLFSMIKCNKKISRAIILYFLCLSSFLCLFESSFRFTWDNELIYSDWDFAKNIAIEQELIESVNAKIDYIKEYHEKGYKIKDCSSNASITSLILEENGGYYDMMLKGNLGNKQKELFLEDFNNQDIILYESWLSWFDVPEVLDLLENNFVLIEKPNDSISADIYVNKNIISDFEKEIIS